MKYLPTWVSLVTIADVTATSGGSRESRALKTVKNHLSINRHGGCDAASPAKSMPTPHRLFQLSGDSGNSGRAAAPQSLPSIPFQLLEGCLSLMQMRPALRLWLQKQRREAEGVQRSQGWWKAGSVAWKKKCTGLLCSSALQQLNEVCFISQSEDFTACVP